MQPMTDSGITVALVILSTLAGLTGFGIYTAFGPPSKELTDSFEEHED